mmetsp:Transcript_14403/g.39029  ORF Transcript_14403/g.39029 Transcript_14403/m.39029 type:complete len:202 (-) Transcript_14403:336-941(-)
MPLCDVEWRSLIAYLASRGHLPCTLLRALAHTHTHTDTQRQAIKLVSVASVMYLCRIVRGLAQDDISFLWAHGWGELCIYGAYAANEALCCTLKLVEWHTTIWCLVLCGGSGKPVFVGQQAICARGILLFDRPLVQRIWSTGRMCKGDYVGRQAICARGILLVNRPFAQRDWLLGAACDANKRGWACTVRLCVRVCCRVYA